jgi:DNA-binding NtrC family response regulator
MAELGPMHILLASDDGPFVDQLMAAAADRGVDLHIVSRETDVDVALARHGANIYVLDADAAVRRGARSATAFAARHPGIPVVLVAERPGSSAVGGLVLLDKWRPSEGLLGAIAVAYEEQRPLA